MHECALFTNVTHETEDGSHVHIESDVFHTAIAVQVRERARMFLEWIMTREEKRIAVVTHSVFLQQMYKEFADTLPEEYHAEVRSEGVGLEPAFNRCTHEVHLLISRRMACR